MLNVLNAGFAPWLIAIALPVAIHLLTRRTRRKMELPTVRFLQKTLANQSQVWKMRHWITLLLRTLAIAALICAFMKPSWVSALMAGSGERAGVVVVLDISESLNYTAGGLSTFAKAKSQVVEILEGLKDGDRANLVLCGASPTLVSEKPTEDLTSLILAARNAQPTEERADGAGAIGLAVEQLAKMNTKVRRIFIVSDFQRTNWSDVRFEIVPPSTGIVFSSVDSDRRENLGITSLQSKPSTPRVGEPTTIQAEVFNSSATARTVLVTLRLSDGRSFTESATAGPQSSANVSFPLTFDRAERVELTASIPGDNLAGDNVRHAVADLQQMATVLLITEEDINATTTASFYFDRALHPDLSSSAGFRVVSVKPRELNNPVLNAADAVIVCNTPTMPPQQYEALARYVTGGGNLMWVLYGDRLAEHLAGFGAKLPKAEPLPFKLEGIANLEAQAKGYVTLSEARYESRLLKAFRDSAAKALSAPKFKKVYITTEVAQRGEVLLKFEDGTAAAVRTGEGSGNLLLLNMSPAPGWSDLGRQEIFVPLLHEFMKGILLKDVGQREAFPGTAAGATVAPTTLALTCIAPDQKPIQVTQDKATGSVVIERTRGPGFYRLAAGGSSVATIPVNPHSDESDLRGIDPRDLESKRQKQVSVLAGASGGVDLTTVRKGVEIWPYLIMGSLICLLIEQLVRRVGPKPVRRSK